MTDKTPPPEKDPALADRTIDIPVPTKDPEFWMKVVQQAFRDTLIFGSISIVLLIVGIGVDVGGVSFSHAGWSAEILGVKLQNAGPGDLLAVTALFMFYVSRFHIKTRRIFTARAQLMMHQKVEKEIDPPPAPTPLDDATLWNTIVGMQQLISKIFGRVALGLILVGVVLVFFGFDLSTAAWTAEGFGLKLVNTGPGVTLVIAGAFVYYFSSFAVGIDGIGETRTLIKRAKWDDHATGEKPGTDKPGSGS
jgi:hypothetical protein